MDIRDRNILVTGAASGIGRSLTIELHRQGARVGVIDKDGPGLERLAAEVPGIMAEVCDVARPNQMARSLEKLSERMGPVEVLVNNAATLLNAPLVGFGPAGIQRHDFAAWDQVIATNLSSVFYVTALVVESMLRRRTRGVVVNLSSIGSAGNPGQSAYSASKAGVDALTVTWAQELGPLGIRVAGVAPGITDTQASTGSLTESALNGLVRRTPLRRLARVDEIMQAILFVIGNDFVHGRTIQVDGGLRM